LVEGQVSSFKKFVVVSSLVVIRGVAIKVSVLVGWSLVSVLGPRNGQLVTTLKRKATVAAGKSLQYSNAFVGVVLLDELVLVELEVGWSHELPPSFGNVGASLVVKNPKFLAHINRIFDVHSRIVVSRAGSLVAENLKHFQFRSLVELVLLVGVALDRIAAEDSTGVGRELITVLGTRNHELLASLDSKTAILA
jgi:hypothetical protein